MKGLLISPVVISHFELVAELFKNLHFVVTFGVEQHPLIGGIKRIKVAIIDDGGKGDGDDAEHGSYLSFI